jgi:hypothetical protein
MSFDPLAFLDPHKRNSADGVISAAMFASFAHDEEQNYRKICSGEGLGLDADDDDDDPV